MIVLQIRNENIWENANIHSKLKLTICLCTSVQTEAFIGEVLGISRNLTNIHLLGGFSCLDGLELMSTLLPQTNPFFAAVTPEIHAPLEAAKVNLIEIKWNLNYDSAVAEWPILR